MRWFVTKVIENLTVECLALTRFTPKHRLVYQRTVKHFLCFVYEIWKLHLDPVINTCVGDHQLCVCKKLLSIVGNEDTKELRGRCSGRAVFKWGGDSNLFTIEMLTEELLSSRLNSIFVWSLRTFPPSSVLGWSKQCKRKRWKDINVSYPQYFVQ